MFLRIFLGSDYRILDFFKKMLGRLPCLFDRVWARGPVGGGAGRKRRSRLATEQAPGIFMTWAEWATQAPLVFSYFLLACLFLNKGRTAQPSAAAAVDWKRAPHTQCTPVGGGCSLGPTQVPSVHVAFRGCCWKEKHSSFISLQF